MDQFERVAVIKKANIYHGGKVTSRTILFEDGTRKTLGIILPGEYEFGTDEKELMEILGGNLKALLPGSDNWEIYEAGQAFTVPASSRFIVSTDEVTDYCCSYIKE